MGGVGVGYWFTMVLFGNVFNTMFLLIQGYWSRLRGWISIVAQTYISCESEGDTFQSRVGEKRSLLEVILVRAMSVIAGVSRG